MTSPRTFNDSALSRSSSSRALEKKTNSSGRTLDDSPLLRSNSFRALDKKKNANDSTLNDSPLPRSSSSRNLEKKKNSSGITLNNSPLPRSNSYRDLQKNNQIAIEARDRADRLDQTNQAGYLLPQASAFAHKDNDKNAIIDDSGWEEIDEQKITANSRDPLLTVVSGRDKSPDRANIKSFVTHLFSYFNKYAGLDVDNMASKFEEVVKEYFKHNQHFRNDSNTKKLLYEIHDLAFDWTDYGNVFEEKLTESLSNDLLDKCMSTDPRTKEEKLREAVDAAYCTYSGRLHKMISIIIKEIDAKVSAEPAKLSDAKKQAIVSVFNEQIGDNFRGDVPLTPPNKATEGSNHSTLISENKTTASISRNPDGNDDTEICYAGIGALVYSENQDASMNPAPVITNKKPFDPNTSNERIISRGLSAQQVILVNNFTRDDKVDHNKIIDGLLNPLTSYFISLPTQIAEKRNQNNPNFQGNVNFGLLDSCGIESAVLNLCKELKVSYLSKNKRNAQEVKHGKDIIKCVNDTQELLNDVLLGSNNALLLGIDSNEYNIKMNKINQYIKRYDGRKDSCERKLAKAAIVLIAALVGFVVGALVGAAIAFGSGVLTGGISAAPGAVWGLLKFSKLTFDSLSYFLSGAILGASCGAIATYGVFGNHGNSKTTVANNLASYVNSSNHVENRPSIRL